MIHIGIDGNEANVLNRVGSNHYAYGILKGIYSVVSLKTSDLKFTIYLKSKPLADMPPESDWWRYKVIGPGFAWTQWRLPLELYKPWGRPNVFYSPGHYAPRRAPIPTVVSIMDLAFLRMPNLFLRYKRGTKQLTEWTEYSVKQAEAVIAISEHTKADVIKFYGTKPEQITVAYPGVDLEQYKVQDLQKVQEVQEVYKLPKKYILHLGTLQPRKNIVRLISAFEQLPTKYKQWHLVFVGQHGWLTDDIEKAINNSPAKDRILRTGYIDQKNIPAVILGASCLAMVGLYEGFGMPPAEAIACGTIPIVSNNTSLPEVVSDAGIQIDPYSVTSIKRGIMIALDETADKKAKRLTIGRKHIQQFSWEKSAEKILEVLIRSVKSKV